MFFMPKLTLAKLHRLGIAILRPHYNTPRELVMPTLSPGVKRDPNDTQETRYDRGEVSEIATNCLANRQGFAGLCVDNSRAYSHLARGGLSFKPKQNDCHCGENPRD